MISSTSITQIKILNNQIQRLSGGTLSHSAKLEKWVEKRKMAISCWITLFLLGENRGKTVFAFLWLSRVSCQPEITRGRKEIRRCDIKGGLAPWKPEAWLLLGKNTGSDCTGAIRSLGLCLKFTITRSPAAKMPGLLKRSFWEVGQV